MRRIRNRGVSGVRARYSGLTLAMVYGVLAFAVIIGIDLIWESGAHTPFWPVVVRDSIEAIIMVLIAAYLYKLREKRLRQVRYLNHHVRNALTLIQMAQQSYPDDEQRQAVIRDALNRICVVLEQMSRNEDVWIDQHAPGKYNKVA